ncbi:MAG: (d)CMP kinase [Oscillospiraceae bacterium]
MPDKFVAIAIDGPSGAGKSTVAKCAAAALGFLYVDTGAIYRSIGYAAYAGGIDPRDEGAIRGLLPELHIEMLYSEDGLQHMILNGKDVTEAIRLPAISLIASTVSAYPFVRDFLMEMQRKLAETHNVIMDGRDIGTVVLPNADVKIFLTASTEERARRRCLELEQRGTPQPYATILQELQQRDFNDTNRQTAPLKAAADAILLDTTGRSFDESCALLLQTVRERL